MRFLQKLYPLVFLLLFFISFSTTLSSSYSATQLCSHEQAAALLQFKSSFSFNNSASFKGYCEYNDTPYSKTESWKEGVDCCSWDGVTCDNVTGHVIGVDLSNSCLHGSFPSNNSLFLIKSLQILNLACNDFKHSQIPREIGQFASLKHLDLSNSEFSGQVPEEISHLSKLVSLDLSRAVCHESSLKFQLKLDPVAFKGLVKNLSEVRKLSLSGVNMSSVDPRYILNLSSSLTDLILLKCDIRGNFPNNIFQFPNLKMLLLGESRQQLTISLPRFNLSSPLNELALLDMLCLGKLPDSIGDLKSLKHLHLACNLQGSIPASIGNLSQLNSLYLSGNNISGSIPSSLTNLTQLSGLYLAMNQLSGPIPFHASGFSKLSSLDLDNNLLNGTIPSWIYITPSLQLLCLNNNQLQGQINQFQQKSLKSIFLGNNKLQGPIPNSIFNLVNLISLDLSSNNLCGTLELDVLSKLQNLVNLDLSNNNLSLKTNPNVNYTLPNLNHLALSSCNLSEFPNFLKKSSKLKFLDLSKNRIECDIPKWIWVIFFREVLLVSHIMANTTFGYDNWPTEFFSVSNNFLTGEISSELCKVNSLEILDLSHNNLSGRIPNCLSKMSGLSVLNLEGNSFHGNLPSMFPKECGLQNFNLHGNQMEGLLPRSLVNCSMLEVLDIGNNNIKDTFPYWMESLPKLQVLVLRSNKFHGSRHTTKANPSFPKLRILDLSDNNFVGPLPVYYIENLKAMVDPHEDNNSSQYMENKNFSSYQYSLMLTMKGHIIELEKVLTILTSIDLSKNKFVGEIPEIIGKLSSLKGLNLSHNSLGGHMPQSLGSLTNLEWLDLSSNELVGEIPQKLVSLTFLSDLNLSNNQLVGLIPQGNQFNTFENSSYEGNLGLCGFPLTKTCDASGTRQQPQGSFHEKGELWGFGWRVVLLGYGCGVVFGLLMGYLVFQTGKPKWFVSLFGVQRNQRTRKIRKARVRALGNI
ncbi:hypothetical protein SLE2022_294840 [Rubroshorea leprosula]